MPTQRLLHSLTGHLRYMQMSRAVLFAFVEGKECDSYIYGQICAGICNQRQIGYELCKANQIPPHAGGKSALLTYHDFLRKRRALKTSLAGKDSIAVFFLDKDIDDLLGRLRRSRHTIYTRYYDVQNEIFLNGDLVRGCASAASLDPALLGPLLSDSRRWCAQAAQKWREWVVLCLVAYLKRIPHQCNYRMQSQVQCPKTGLVDLKKVTQLCAEMSLKSRLPAADFTAHHGSVSKRVAKMYSYGEQDRVFKGKWYAFLLDQDIGLLMGQAEYDRSGFASRVTSAVAATLIFPSRWAEHYSTRLAAVLDNT